MQDAPTRFKLTIAYDGRPFRGWQSQPEGNTIQDVLEATLSQVAGGTPIRLHGSGRTDAGVHALGQCAHFDAPSASRLTAADWRRALNSLLPQAIRIFECTEAPPGFHARFNAREKEYQYKIFTGAVLPPLSAGLAWHLPRPLDLDAMERAAGLFLGKHDFANFAANRRKPGARLDPAAEGALASAPEAGAARATTRTLRCLELFAPSGEPGSLVLRFRGDGFLYKMVRLITGSLVRCALGKAQPEWLQGLLEKPGDPALKSPYCAPPDGLYLVRVDYR